MSNHSTKLKTDSIFRLRICVWCTIESYRYGTTVCNDQRVISHIFQYNTIIIIITTTRETFECDFFNKPSNICLFLCHSENIRKRTSNDTISKVFLFINSSLPAK